MTPVAERDAQSLASWLGPESWGGEFERRFRAWPRADANGSERLRIGVLFGPRAAARLIGRRVRCKTALTGALRVQSRTFGSTAELAQLWADDLNASFERSQIASRVAVGAVDTLTVPERVPAGASVLPWLRDALDNRVREDELPLECWAQRHRLSSVVLVLDWNMSLRRLANGHWGGLTAAAARRESAQALPVFHPVSTVDAFCALYAFSLAHEFGHQLGLVHDRQHNALAPLAVPPPANDDDRRTPYPVMAMPARRERDRHLEWSRPAPSGIANWRWGNAQHDEAAWLREALPLLARHELRCAGVCGGRCGQLKWG